MKTQKKQLNLSVLILGFMKSGKSRKNEDKKARAKGSKLGKLIKTCLIRFLLSSEVRMLLSFGYSVSISFMMVL